MKKCIIIGAGSAVAQNFIDQYQKNFEIHAFARKNLEQEFDIQFYQTNYQDLENYKTLFNQANTIIYCIGVTNASDDEIKKINIDVFDNFFKLIETSKNVIFISSAAILFNQGAYVDSKLHAENYLKNSKHNYISLRPSVMHGKFDKNNIIKMQEFIQKLPFIPVIAPNYVIQPVYMKDIARVMANAINKNKFTNKNYVISGPAQVKLYNVFSLLKRKLKSKKILIPIPLKPVQIIVKILSYFLPKDLIMAHQILNMKIHAPFDSSELVNDLDYKNQSFEETIFEY